MSNLITQQISFENTAIAYKNLSDKKLKWVHFLFSMMNKPWLVNYGSKATLFALKIKFPITSLIKSTIFDQFCGGEDLDDTSNVTIELSNQKLEVLLNYSVEGLEDERSFLRTYRQAVQSIEYASNYKNIRAICLKFTGYGRIALFEKIQAGIALTDNEKNLVAS